MEKVREVKRLVKRNVHCAPTEQEKAIIWLCEAIEEGPQGDYVVYRLVGEKLKQGDLVTEHVKDGKYDRGYQDCQSEWIHEARKRATGAAANAIEALITWMEA